MIKKLIFCVTTFFLCQSLITDTDSFDQYYHLLKVIDLPLFIDCQKGINYPNYLNIPDKLDKKYRPNGHKTLGRIDLNKKIISIIQVAQAEPEYPYVFNYKIDGTPIDTFALVSGSCESSPESRSHSVCLVTKAKRIQLTDSVVYYKINNKGFRLEKCDSIIINITYYIMENDGRFKMTFQLRKKV
jgi:hypothetical protein